MRIVGDTFQQIALAGGQQFQLIYEQFFCIHIFVTGIQQLTVFLCPASEHQFRPPAMLDGVSVTLGRTCSNGIDITRRRALFWSCFRVRCGGCILWVQGAFCGCICTLRPVALAP